MRPRLFYCDHEEIPLPPGHRFPIRKYARIRQILEADGIFDLQPATMAEAGTIALAHDPDYVRRFLAGELTADSMRRIGFPWSEGLVRRTLASVGGTLAATEDALDSGWGGTLAGGTHHAFRAAGAGFCVFNDIAIAIYSLRRRGLISRAAVIDLDVHQGDGTAEIFNGDPDVMTVSLHCKANFPFRKQSSTVDVELDEGTGDAEYLRALRSVLPGVVEFAPEIVFYQSGVDGLATDALGKLALSAEGLQERDRCVLGMASAAQSPVVVTLGGGYSVPMELTAAAHANTYRIAAEIIATRLAGR